MRRCNIEVLFLQRVLFIHDRVARRGGKAALLRLSLQEWCNECESWRLLMIVD